MRSDGITIEWIVYYNSNAAFHSTRPKKSFGEDKFGAFEWARKNKSKDTQVVKVTRETIWDAKEIG